MVKVSKLFWVIATFFLFSTQVFAQGEGGCSHGMVKAPAVLTPEQTVDQFVDAFNTGDMVALQNMFREDAWYAYGDSAPVSGEAMLAWLESEMLGATMQISSTELYGDTVIVAGTNLLDGTSTGFTYVFNVKAGLIESWQIL
jgi:ketosteroid isomerase-like protein